MFSTNSLQPTLMSRRIGAFVGRTTELTVLRSEWLQVREGASGVVLVSGEAGIGKSELVNEFARSVAPRGSVVACRPSLSGARAHALIADLIRRLVGTLGNDIDLNAIHDVGQRALGQLVPETFGSEDNGSPIDPTGAALEVLCEAMGRLLREAASRTPILVVIEDLHAATQDSLKVVSALVEQRIAATLFVLTTRAPEPRRQRLEALIDVARTTGAFRSLDLKGLAIDEVVDLVESVAEVGDPDSLGAALHRRTGGHPFFATSILQTIRHDGSILPDDHLDRTRVPDEIAAHITRQVKRLAPAVRRALEAGAVIGDSVPVHVLASVLRVTPDELIDRLVEATDAGLVASGFSDSGMVRFSHELIRDAIYWPLHALRRAQLHRNVADAIRIHYTPDLVAAYAVHCSMAAPVYPELRTRSVAASIEAARDAVTRIAYSDAIDHYRRALTYASTDSERSRIEVGLGDAHARAGDLRVARRHLDNAAALARKLHDVPLLAEIATALSAVVFQSNASDPVLRELYEDVLKLLPKEDVFWRVRLIAARAREMATQSASQRLAQSAEETVERAIRHEDSATRAYAYFVRFDANVGERDTDMQASNAEQMTLAAEAARDPYLLSIAYMFSATTALGGPDIAGATRSIEACQRVADQYRYPYASWLAAMLRAGCMVWQQPLKAAADAVEGAHRLGQPLGYGEVDVAYMVQRGILYRELGRADEALPALRYAAGAYDPPGWKAGLAVYLCEAQEGDRNEVVRLLTDIEQVGFDALLPDGGYAMILSLLAEAYDHIGDQRAASRLLPVMETNRHQQPVAGYTAVYCGSMDYRIGLLRATIGEYDGAIADFKAACTVDARSGSPLWTCHTKIAFAQTLRSRNCRGDIAAAHALEVDVRDVAETCEVGRTQGQRQLLDPSRDHRSRNRRLCGSSDA